MISSSSSSSSLSYASSSSGSSSSCCCSGGGGDNVRGRPAAVLSNSIRKRRNSSRSSSTSSLGHAASSVAATATAARNILTTTTLKVTTTTTTASTNRYREFCDWRGGDDKKWKYHHHNQQDVMGTAGDPSSLTTTTTTKPPCYLAAVCTAQGHRSYMEDEFFLSADGDFAAVFDGHGGHAVSRYLRQNLYANLQAFLPVVVTTTHPTSSTTTTPIPPSCATTTNSTTTTTSSSSTSLSSSTTSSSTTNTITTTNDIEDEEWSEANDGLPHKRIAPTVQDYETALEAALDKVDQEVQRISHCNYQGSTAVAVWVHEEKNPAAPPTKTTTTTTTPSKRTIVAANVGDSRAVLYRNGTAWELTRDHKPNDPYEKERIEGLGGQVIWCGSVDKEGEPILKRGIYRVNGNLALARAIGDQSHRPYVTADPEIISVPIIEGEDEFIVLATDGLWDVMHSGEVIEFVKTLQDAGYSHEKIPTLVVEEALERGTYDNITVVIIWLNRQSPPPPQQQQQQNHDPSSTSPLSLTTKTP